MQGEEEVRQQLGGDEVAHLGGVRVEHEDGDERQGDQADLVAEQRHGLAEPEAPEHPALAQERRDHHGRGALVASRDARAARPDRRHRRLGRHLRPGQGRGRALSALRVPGRPVPDRVASCSPCPPRRGCARSAGAAGSRASSLGLLLAARLRAADGRARADDRLERRLHHRPLRRLHAAARPAALPHARRPRGLARCRARRRRAGDALRRRRRRSAPATCSCSPARPPTRSRSC